MTTKKIVIIVAAVVFTVGLLVLTFVGAVVGIAFYSIGKSEAAMTAKDFLRNNERLREDVGTVQDFGSFITGNINIHDSDGNAVLNLKVIGERRTVNASVELSYQSGRPWRVTAASYKNEAGEIVDLLSAFETKTPAPLLVA
jgi:hypothetical protein